MGKKCYFHVNDEGYVVEPVMIGNTRVCNPTVEIHHGWLLGNREDVIIRGELIPKNMNNDVDFVCLFYRTIKRIIFSGPMTIVFWDDGTKTKVRLHEEKGKKKGVYDKYTAVTWAMAKNYYGSRSQLEKRLRDICDDSKYDNMLVYTMLSALFGDPKKLDEYVNDALKIAEDYNEQ